MLYQIHEWQRSFLGPLSHFAHAGARMLNDHSSPFAQLPGAQRMAAGYELVYRLGKDYEKPEFDIHAATAHDHEIAVIERVALAKPFCELKRFKRFSDDPATIAKMKTDPVVLVVAPLSGHHATLLRDTVRTLLRDHKVYITDWVDARMVPAGDGPVRAGRLHRLYRGIHPPYRRSGAARDLGMPADRAGTGGRVADGVAWREYAADA